MIVLSTWMDPGNHGNPIYDIYPTLPGFKLVTCSVTRASQFLLVTVMDSLWLLMVVFFSAIVCRLSLSVSLLVVTIVVFGTHF